MGRGSEEGSVEASVGSLEGSGDIGIAVGASDGGSSVPVGFTIGLTVGSSVGASVSAVRVGSKVRTGSLVGAIGAIIGCFVGGTVSVIVGSGVSLAVGLPVHSHSGVQQPHDNLSQSTDRVMKSSSSSLLAHTVSGIEPKRRFPSSLTASFSVSELMLTVDGHRSKQQFLMNKGTMSVGKFNNSMGFCGEATLACVSNACSINRLHFLMVRAYDIPFTRIYKYIRQYKKSLHITGEVLTMATSDGCFHV